VEHQPRDASPVTHAPGDSWAVPQAARLDEQTRSWKLPEAAKQGRCVMGDWLRTAEPDPETSAATIAEPFAGGPKMAGLQAGHFLFFLFDRSVVFLNNSAALPSKNLLGFFRDWVLWQ